MKKLIAICLSILILISSGCGKGKEIKRYQAEFLSLFDTVTIIVGFSDSKAEFSKLAEAIKGTLEEYHKLYDIYNDYEGISNIKTINDNAGRAPVVVDAKIIDMLEFAKQAYTVSDGSVNVAFGSVLSIWHQYRESGINDPENAELPPIELLKKAALHTNIDDIIIDREASSVYIKDPGMRLDVGAIAKGYAAEQTALYYEKTSITSLLLSVGGNVRAIGGKQDGDSLLPWSIGIQNPDKTSSVTELMNIKLYGAALVSSGVYERYYTVNGEKYHHIIDPDTLMPSTYYSAVSIICPDSGLADALSTAVFSMPPDKGKALIESIPDTEAIWIYSDGSQEYTSGFMDRVE